MPTYRYRCAKCGDELELWQSFSDKPLTRHNGGCGGKLAKVLSPAGIVLKGSGFYKTDNRKSNGARTGKDSGTSESTGSETKGGGSSSGGSESSSPASSKSSGSSGSKSSGKASSGSSKSS
jgi:putative FmdB family regulatory protein